MAEPVSKIIVSLGKAGAITGLLLAAGIGIGWLWAQYAPVAAATYGPWVQLLSGAFFLWAVLALLGWKIQTWEGQTPAEKLNRWAFRVLNCVGMFFLFVSSSALIFVRTL